MAKLTKAQREWRPGMPKKRRSTKVMFASTVLLLEAFVAFFATLAVFGLRRGEISPALILVGGHRPERGAGPGLRRAVQAVGRGAGLDPAAGAHPDRLRGTPDVPRGRAVRPRLVVRHPDRHPDRPRSRPARPRSRPNGTPRTLGRWH